MCQLQSCQSPSIKKADHLSLTTGEMVLWIAIEYSYKLWAKNINLIFVQTTAGFDKVNQQSHSVCYF